MKYIAYAINYPTLCRALRYIDTQWGKENTVLFYATLVSPLPEGVSARYNVIEIAGHNRGRISGFEALYADFSTANTSWKKLRRLLKDTDEDFTLVVFRDNEAPEATLIEKAARHFPKRFHLWIMEEGVGLYRTDRNPVRSVWVKKLLYRMLGISTYALKNVSQGEHPRIEKVICQHPDWATEKFRDKQIQQQLDVFVPEFNLRFAEYVLGALSREEGGYDYVFLTTPIAQCVNFTEEYAKRYAQFLDEMVSYATAGGKLLIKCHPRDTYDYSKYQNMPNVKVCSALENQVPFECLHAYYGLPQMISIGSSVSLKDTGGKPTIFVHNLLDVPTAIESLLAKHAPESMILCQTMEDLKRALTK